MTYRLSDRQTRQVLSPPALTSFFITDHVSISPASPSAGESAFAFSETAFTLPGHSFSLLTESVPILLRSTQCCHDATFRQFGHLAYPNLPPFTVLRRVAPIRIPNVICNTLPHPICLRIISTCLCPRSSVRASDATLMAVSCVPPVRKKTSLPSDLWAKNSFNSTSRSADYRRPKICLFHVSR